MPDQIHVQLASYELSISFCCLEINLKTPKVAPLHLVGGTRSLFFLTRVFWGIYVSCFGAGWSLLDVSIIHFVVSLLSQINRSWAWLTNAPMPQPCVCSVFSERKIHLLGYCSLQNRRDFCVFKGTGAKARRARSASCVRGEVR